MQDLIELAIEREEERLDAFLEVPEIFDAPLFPRHNSRFGGHPETRKVLLRATTPRRFSHPTRRSA